MWDNFGIQNHTWQWLNARQTPFYLYSTSVLQDSYHKLRMWADQNQFAQIFYSLKSNPHPFIIKELMSMGCHFDVSSQNEYELARRIGVKTSHLTVSGPAKSFSFLSTVSRHGARCIHVDSKEELSDLIQIKSNVAISLRLSPEQGLAQKVGMPDHDIRQILQNQTSRVCGFHTYLGRERYSIDERANFISRCRQWTQEYPLSFDQSQPLELFFGAGLPASSLLPDGMTHIQQNSIDGLKVHLECGRAVVHECALYGAPVLAIKNSSKQRIVIIDGGYQHMASHLSSPKFGYQGVECIAFRNGHQLMSPANKFNVHGSLSVWHDILIEGCELPEDIRRGDWLIFRPAGAYGWTAACNQFIGASKIEEFKFENDKYINISPNPFLSYHESI